MSELEEGHRRRAASVESEETLWVHGLRELLELDDEAFYWRGVSSFDEVGHVKGQSSFHPRLCIRCLRGASQPQGGAPATLPELHMLNECKHFICSECVKEGQKAGRSRLKGGNSTELSNLVCGFCGADNSWMTANQFLPPTAGPRILCLDGGGIKGLVEITVLKALVDLTGVPVHELFDVIGGSSTGGILAIAYGACKLTPEEAHDMYVSLTSKIFQRQGLSRFLPDVMLYALGHTILSNNALREGLGSSFGDPSLSFGDFPNLPKFFVTAFDSYQEQTVVFGNFEPTSCLDDRPEHRYGPAPMQQAAHHGEGGDACPEENSHTAAKPAASEEGGSNSANPSLLSSLIRPSGHVNLVNAALATSAAPMYFPSVSIDDEIYVDGGVDANCPVVEALGVAKQVFADNPLEILVSIGAGSSDSTKQAPKEDLRDRGVEWISAIVNLQMESNRKWSNTINHVAEEVRAKMVRLNPDTVGDFDPFDASKREEIVELTRRKLGEAPLSSQVAEAAGRLRSKMYFLNMPSRGPDVVQTAHRELSSFMSDMAAASLARSSVVRTLQVLVEDEDYEVALHIHERPTENSVVPRAKIRRFRVEANPVALTVHEPAGSADPQHRPRTMELPLDDAQLLDYSREAVGGVIHFRIRTQRVLELVQSSRTQRSSSQSGGAGNGSGSGSSNSVREGRGGAGRIDASPGGAAVGSTGDARTHFVNIRTALNVSLLGKVIGVPAGHYHPISGCPCMLDLFVVLPPAAPRPQEPGPG